MIQFEACFFNSDHYILYFTKAYFVLHTVNRKEISQVSLCVFLVVTLERCVCHNHI